MTTNYRFTKIYNEIKNSRNQCRDIFYPDFTNAIYKLDNNIDNLYEIEKINSTLEKYKCFEEPKYLIDIAIKDYNEKIKTPLINTQFDSGKYWYGDEIKHEPVENSINDIIKWHNDKFNKNVILRIFENNQIHEYKLLKIYVLPDKWSKYQLFIYENDFAVFETLGSGIPILSHTVGTIKSLLAG